jgi:hypothetical protein
MCVYCHQPEPLIHGPVSSSERFLSFAVVIVTAASIVADECVWRRNI